MVASIIIIAFSVVLFAYWFRYSCILILRTRTSVDYATHVAKASSLAVLEIQRLLEGSADELDLSAFRSALEEDYLIVNQLLSKAPMVEEHLSSVEQIMLRIDFRMMSIWDSVSRTCLGGPSRVAVAEIASIVGCLANAAGSAGVLSVES
ncbi:hypothetical protein [Paludibaculum fermentans]|uniref:Uncharacterized protein n=1 Tax=Paludibaculum fermentans TaxID=1473598 RepID=A0A7S7NNJ1_PALFE|nr:hypothetical protein [Paludibaculum fermentans]QOY86898.1 hypothetical protein IRI77_29595 [Paludibaculum fermentans]